MFTTHTNFSNHKTWVVVANRSGARIFESDGGVKNLHQVADMPNPRGRLKNGEIDSDRDGKGIGEAGANFPTHGLNNKNRAVTHEMEIFAKQIGSRIMKARAENVFSRLILVAEPAFLGELRGSLDSQTQSSIFNSVPKELVDVNENSLKKRVAELLS